MCVLKQAWSRSYPLVQPVEFIQTGWHRRLHIDGEGSSYKFYLNNNLFSILLLIFLSHGLVYKLLRCMYVTPFRYLSLCEPMST